MSAHFHGWPGIVVALMSITGCTAALDLAGARPTGPHPVTFPECRADSYDFVGKSTLAQLGLDTATPVRPPEPNRVAMIWVTHQLIAEWRDAPGAAAEMTRMLCFEFDDGSGGSEWPIDPSWQPPGVALSTADGEAPVSVLPLLAIAASALVIGASVAAFRRTPSDRGRT